MNQGMSETFLRLFEARCFIDKLASFEYSLIMLNNAELKDIRDKLKTRLDESIRTINEAGKELDGLQEVEERIHLLRNQVDDARISASRITHMLGNDKTRAKLKQIDSAAERRDIQQSSKYSRSKAVSVRSFMDEYLKVAGESKVGDIVSFLQHIGVDYAKRQTVETALKNHPDEFEVIKRGREKFVSLTRSDW